MFQPYRSFLCLSVYIGSLLFALPWAKGEISYELDTNYSVVGGAGTDFERKRWGGAGNVSEQSAQFCFVASPQLTETSLLRVGMNWQYYSFGLPAKAPLPSVLQTTALVLGADVQFDSWLLRVEATPGFYSGSTEFNGDTINVPVIIGGSYLASPELQWIIGCEIDVNTRYFLMPGVGVRWKFAEKWVCDAILPKPRLEYAFNKSLTLYGGCDVRTGSYRVAGNFGDRHGDPALNRAVVEYTEIRAGAGASWKISRSLTVEAEAGYMPYRDFEYRRAGYDIESTGGAPYGQIAIGGRF